MGRLLHTWFQDLAGFWSVALPEATISEEAGRAGHLRRISGSSSRDRMWARSGENEGDCLLVFVFFMFVFLLSNSRDRGVRIWEARVPAYVGLQAQGQDVGQVGGVSGGLLVGFCLFQLPLRPVLGTEASGSGRGWSPAAYVGLQAQGQGVGQVGGVSGGLLVGFLSLSAPFASSLGDRGFRIWEGLVTCGVRRAPGTGTGCGPGRGRTREGRCTRPG